jgi:uroporphyrinogen decarboxylase
MPGKETMIPRERVLKALNHEIPDRVPIDLGGFQTGIHKRAYADLISHLGMKEEIETLDPIQQLARPSENVLKRFHVDVRYVYAHSPDSFQSKIEQNTRAGKLQHDLKDEFGVIWSIPDDKQFYMDISYHPLADANITDLNDYPFPDGSDRNRFIGVREKILQMRKETPYAISTGTGGGIYETCWSMRGLQKWYTDMAQNPEFCKALLDKTLKFWIDYYTGLLAEVGDIVDFVMTADDLAGQYGPLFSPKFYRKDVKPRQKKLIKHIKSLTGAKIWYHTCGSCIEYIPDLLDNRIDILNPIQTSAKDMDPKLLKEKYGTQLVFWGGGIDAQHVLGVAKPSEIREHVRRNIEIFKPEGGYVFSSTHNIQFDVPAENIMALFDAAYEFGFYD